MNDWYRPPITWKPPSSWKPPGIRKRTRRLISGLWLAMLITLNTIQPALAISVQPLPEGKRAEQDFLTATWDGMAMTAAVANYFANEPAGTITNTVTVSSDTTDPLPINNSATQTTTVTSQADLLISKDDGLTSALPGTVITYTIIVTNAGPSAVTNAPVADALPAAITDASWNCGASSGSACADASGTGDMATTVDLAVNGTATFTVVATLSPTATGSVANTATVSPPINTTDPNPDNNDDTDTDNLLTGVLTGTLYLDDNGDASYNGGEGLTGITVVITTSVGYVFTTTTDANGNYTVTVPAGDTIADVDDADLPTGAVQIEGDDPTTVTVPAGGSAGSVDGYEQQGQVTGHIYQDTNGNGTQDSGEADLPNVSVIITDTFGVTQTVTTDANGNYTATVPIGTNPTTADVVEATLPAGSVQTEGSDPTTQTAVAGTSVDIGTDGYQPQGVVDGTIYMDENGDGVYTDGVDTPLPNVTVVITDSNGVTYTAITDADGYYSQTVPSGDTTVDVNDDDLDPTVVLTGGSTDPTTVTVPGGGTATDDTGYVLLASIGDYIWLDLNGDGLQDANEPGLAGVDVELTDENGDTVTATTGPNGYYTFDDLRPGTFTVTVVVATLPAGVTQTYDPDGAVDHEHTVTIASDAEYEDADFGYQGSASIGDLVWLDSNGDTSSAGEVGIPDVLLTLTMANGWEITTTTAGDGSYDFGGLIGGAYTVTVDTDTLPVGSVLTTENQPLTVTLGSTQDYNLADFGYQRQAALTGHIFEDTDGNGVQNSSEPNLSGVTVVITDSLGLTQTVTTDGNGNYTATVPVDSTTSPTDTVTVDVDETTLPVGAVQTAGTDPDSVEVTAGATTDAGDDGYQIQGVIEGVVYTDVNQNGSYDAGTDTPLDGVDVVITDSNGVTSTVATNADGYFSKTVPAGPTGVDVSNDDVAAINPDLMIENGFTDPDNSQVVPGGGVATTNFPYVEPLTIDKDTSTATVVAGTQATYQIVLRNIGGLALTNVTVSDTLPVSFTFASATINVTNATRTATSAPVVGDSVPTWGSWTINPGGQVTIEFVVDVGSDVLPGDFDNTATANSDQTAQITDDGTTAQDENTPLGTDPEDDEDVTVTTAADLAITKLDDPDPVVAGGLLTYTIQVVNNGPSDAQNVVVSDNLSADTTFVSAPGCTEAAGVVSCALGTVPNGAVVNITIVVTVAPDLIAYGDGDSGSAIAMTPAANELVLNRSEEVSQLGAEEVALTALPVAPAAPTSPQSTTFFFSGGGGGPGSSGAGSGLTAAPVGASGLLAEARSQSLQQRAMNGRLGITAADALSRAGPPDPFRIMARIN